MPLAAREAAAYWDRAIRNDYATGGTIYGYHPHVTYTTTSSTMTNAVWNVNTTTATSNTTTWLLNYNLPEQADGYRQRLMERQLWQGHDVMEYGTVDEGDPMRQPDAEQAAAHRARMRERAQEREQRVIAGDAARVRAEERAAASLRAFLGDARHDFWRQRRLLVVRGSEGGIFVLRPGTITNVTQIRENRMTVRRLCAHPELEVRDANGRFVGALPMDDVIIGQVLALTTNEREFCRIANVTNVGRDDVQGIGHSEWREWLAIEQREDNPDIINGGGPQVVVQLNDERTQHDANELALERRVRQLRERTRLAG